MPKTYYAGVVLSRCLTYEIKMSYFQLMDFMYEIGDKEVCDYIKENSSPATRGFDLRLLRKAEKFKEFDKDNWKFLINPMLNDVDEHIQLVLQGCSDIEWKEKTGLSITTKDRVRRKLGLTRTYNSSIRHENPLYKEKPDFTREITQNIEVK